jgi:hypothetical protein
VVFTFFMVLAFMMLLFMVIMMVVSRHGDLFDTMVRMDHPHVGIGAAIFSSQAFSNGTPMAK